MTEENLSVLAPVKTTPSLILVRPDSPVKGISTAICSSIREDLRVTVRAIGAGAVNQAMKGVIQARQQLAGNGEDLVIRPGFMTLTGRDSKEVTAIVMNCYLS